MSAPFLHSVREHLAGNQDGPFFSHRRPRLRTWHLLRRLLGRGYSPRNLHAERESLREARKQLREITGDLATIKTRLHQVADSLPEPATEDLLLDNASELRAIISCVIKESIRPAIDDLWGASFLVLDQPTTGSEDEAAS